LVSEDYSCKLTDFGCAKLLNTSASYLNTVNSGTPLWMAPEVKMGQYSFPADIYSLGLVLFELFEKQLPHFDPMTQRVILPTDFQSASVVKPMVNLKPDQRPTAQHTITVLDQMVNSICETIRKNFTKEEMEQLKKDAGTTGDDTQAAVDRELGLLYRQLLAKPAKEVDAKINKYFQVKPSAPRPAAAASSGQAPPYGYPPGVPMGSPIGVPMGYPPGMPGYASAPAGFPPGYPGQVPMGMPMTYPQAYPGMPVQMPPGYPPMGYPPGY